MKFCFTGLLLCLLVSSYIEISHAEKNWGWDYCNCRFNPWEGWSDCTSTCFGSRQRTRSVRLTQYPNCDSFYDCATRDEGIQEEGCNEVCHNGGVKADSSCDCQDGFTGKCCTTRITCGKPDNINNGAVTYPLDTFYGDTATYTCNQHYNLTGGSGVRTCQLNGAWSDQKPSCKYVNHCASTPCENGATCTDKLDDYECTCQSGWSGIHCENDVQPPVMYGCQADETVYTATRDFPYSWTEPTFVDPQGTAIQVTANYPNTTFVFPHWADYTIQYVATKPSNGLQTECKFEVKGRPYPCEELNVPANGARICNGWDTDYGRFCMVACESTYTIDPWTTASYDTLYVCGASGTWTAAAPMPDCDVANSMEPDQTPGNPASDQAQYCLQCGKQEYRSQRWILPTKKTPKLDTQDILAVQSSYNDYSYNSACLDPQTRQLLQERFIFALIKEGSFPAFCDTDECIPDNVLVNC